MKSILILSLLFTLTLAQPTAPQIVVLSSRPRCSPKRVQDDIQCGCFYAFFQGLATREVRAACRQATGTPIRNSQSTCNPYLTNAQNYNELQILQALQRVKNTCFGGRVTFARNFQENFEILKRGEALFKLVNQLCNLLGQPTVSEVPPFRR